MIVLSLELASSAKTEMTTLKPPLLGVNLTQIDKSFAQRSCHPYSSLVHLADVVLKHIDRFYRLLIALAVDSNKGMEVKKCFQMAVYDGLS